jgi:two-component sensor histidine kinase
MQFHADFLRAGRGQKTQRFALEHQRGVGGVVNDHEAVLERELHHRAKNSGVALAPVGLFG